MDPTPTEQTPKITDAECELEIETRVSRYRFWLFASLTVLFMVTFIYYLPLRFESRMTGGGATHDDTHNDATATDDRPHDSAMSTMMEEHTHEDGTTEMHMMGSADLNTLPLRTPLNRLEQMPFVKTADGYKEFHLEASAFRWEYAPGQWVHVWGYNGQIPGPEIRVTEGEKVRVVVKNSLPDATSVHWHGLDVPWQMDGVAGVTQKAIEPGEAFTYEFTAKPAGTRFYHSHGKDHASAAQQLDMGLSGAFIVEPRSERLAYDRDYTLLLDEWDILAGGVNSAISHVHGAGMMGAVPDFNTFTINGRIFPHVPNLDIKKGESVLVRFINAGTSAFHPMHLHGHSFAVVARDGFLLENPEERNTITVNPGETVDILIEGNNPGPWLLHCHHVHHAAAGMTMLMQYEGYEPIQPLQ